MTDIELRDAAERILVEVLGHSRAALWLFYAELHAMSSSPGQSRKEYILSVAPGEHERFTEFRSEEPAHILTRLKNYAKQQSNVREVVKC